MDSQAQSQYTSDGPTASSRHHTSTGHPLHLQQQYNSHNQHLPLFSPPYSTSPTSAFSGVVHQQQQQPGPGQWTTHRSGTTAMDEVLPPPHQSHQPQQQSQQSLKRDSTSGIMSQPNTKVESSSSSSSNGHGHHASDDPMPSTSDFVKKLYKCVFPFFFTTLGGRLIGRGCVGCWKTRRSRRLFRGDLRGIVSSSRCVTRRLDCV